jgi:hypothetical protein
LVLQFPDFGAVDQAFGQNAPNLLFRFVVGRLATETHGEPIPDRIRVGVVPCGANFHIVTLHHSGLLSTSHQQINRHSVNGNNAPFIRFNQPDRIIRNVQLASHGPRDPIPSTGASDPVRPESALAVQVRDGGLIRDNRESPPVGLEVE